MEADDSQGKQVSKGASLWKQLGKTALPANEPKHEETQGAKLWKRGLSVVAVKGVVGKRKKSKMMKTLESYQKLMSMDKRASIKSLAKTVSVFAKARKYSHFRRFAESKRKDNFKERVGKYHKKQQLAASLAMSDTEETPSVVGHFQKVKESEQNFVRQLQKLIHACPVIAEDTPFPKAEKERRLSEYGYDEAEERADYLLDTMFGKIIGEVDPSLLSFDEKRRRLQEHSTTVVDKLISRLSNRARSLPMRDFGSWISTTSKPLQEENKALLGRYQASEDITSVFTANNKHLEESVLTAEYQEFAAVNKFYVSLQRVVRESKDKYGRAQQAKRRKSIAEAEEARRKLLEYQARCDAEQRRYESELSIHQAQLDEKQMIVKAHLRLKEDRLAAKTKEGGDWGGSHSYDILLASFQDAFEKKANRFLQMIDEKQHQVRDLRFKLKALRSEIETIMNMLYETAGRRLLEKCQDQVDRLDLALMDVELDNNKGNDKNNINNSNKEVPSSTPEKTENRVLAFSSILEDVNQGAAIEASCGIADIQRRQRKSFVKLKEEKIARIEDREHRRGRKKKRFQNKKAIAKLNRENQIIELNLERLGNANATLQRRVKEQEQVKAYKSKPTKDEATMIEIRSKLKQEIEEFSAKGKNNNSYELSSLREKHLDLAKEIKLYKKETRIIQVSISEVDAFIRNGKISLERTKNQETRREGKHDEAIKAGFLQETATIATDANLISRHEETKQRMIQEKQAEGKMKQKVELCDQQLRDVEEQIGLIEQEMLFAALDSDEDSVDSELSSDDDITSVESLVAIEEQEEIYNSADYDYTTSDSSSSSDASEETSKSKRGKTKSNKKTRRKASSKETQQKSKNKSKSMQRTRGGSTDVSVKHDEERRTGQQQREERRQKRKARKAEKAAKAKQQLLERDSTSQLIAANATVLDIRKVDVRVLLNALAQSRAVLITLYDKKSPPKATMDEWEWQLQTRFKIVKRSLNIEKSAKKQLIDGNKALKAQWDGDSPEDAKGYVDNQDKTLLAQIAKNSKAKIEAHLCESELDRRRSHFSEMYNDFKTRTSNLLEKVSSGQSLNSTTVLTLKDSLESLNKVHNEVYFQQQEVNTLTHDLRQMELDIEISQCDRSSLYKKYSLLLLDELENEALVNIFEYLIQESHVLRRLDPTSEMTRVEEEKNTQEQEIGQIYKSMQSINYRHKQNTLTDPYDHTRESLFDAKQYLRVLKKKSEATLKEQRTKWDMLKDTEKVYLELLEKAVVSEIDNSLVVRIHATKSTCEHKREQFKTAQHEVEKLRDAFERYMDKNNVNALIDEGRKKGQLVEANVTKMSEHAQAIKDGTTQCSLLTNIDEIDNETLHAYLLKTKLKDDEDAEKWLEDEVEKVQAASALVQQELDSLQKSMSARAMLQREVQDARQGLAKASSLITNSQTEIHAIETKLRELTSQINEENVEEITKQKQQLRQLIKDTKDQWETAKTVAAESEAQIKVLTKAVEMDKIKYFDREIKIEQLATRRSLCYLQTRILQAKYMFKRCQQLLKEMAQHARNDSKFIFLLKVDEFEWLFAFSRVVIGKHLVNMDKLCVSLDAKIGKEPLDANIPKLLFNCELIVNQGQQLLRIMDSIAGTKNRHVPYVKMDPPPQLETTESDKISYETQVQVPSEGAAEDTSGKRIAHNSQSRISTLKATLNTVECDVFYGSTTDQDISQLDFDAQKEYDVDTVVPLIDINGDENAHTSMADFLQVPEKAQAISKDMVVASGATSAIAMQALQTSLAFLTMKSPETVKSIVHESLPEPAKASSKVPSKVWPRKTFTKKAGMAALSCFTAMATSGVQVEPEEEQEDSVPEVLPSENFQAGTMESGARVTLGKIQRVLELRSQLETILDQRKRASVALTKTSQKVTDLEKESSKQQAHLQMFEPDKIMNLAQLQQVKKDLYHEASCVADLEIEYEEVGSRHAQIVEMEASTNASSETTETQIELSRLRERASELKMERDDILARMEGIFNVEKAVNPDPNSTLGKLKQLKIQEIASNGKLEALRETLEQTRKRIEESDRGLEYIAAANAKKAENRDLKLKSKILLQQLNDPTAKAHQLKRIELREEKTRIEENIKMLLYRLGEGECPTKQDTMLSSLKDELDLSDLQEEPIVVDEEETRLKARLESYANQVLWWEDRWNCKMKENENSRVNNLLEEGT